MIDRNALAQEFGFERILSVCTCVIPSQRPELASDPRALLPQARSIWLLAASYAPYKRKTGQAQLDAYYPRSNFLHAQTIALAERLRREGVQALPSPAIPYKPLFAGSGLGAYGRNCLLALPGLGTRVCLQAILTDETGERDDWREFSLDPACASCHACERACPTGALRGDGRLDMNRCLRALPESEPAAEKFRALLGESVLGCDICQRVCPRNAGVAAMEEPEEVKKACELSRLLRGDTAELAALIGKNNARKGRTQARAILRAVCEKRVDVRPLVEALQSSPFRPAAVYAEWALAEWKRGK